jgi:hypothetical protein
MSVDENILDDCERRHAAAGRLATAAVDAHTAVLDLTRLLEMAAADDSGFYAGQGAEDAAESAAIARRALRDIRRIAEARETDLSDQLDELRGAYADEAADRA